MTQKVTLRFSKLEEMRFVSNLDLQRVFEQALRRAAIPVAFSQGFHPRPRFALGPALPLGIESDDEVVTIRLDRPLDSAELVQRLNRALPDGLAVRTDQAGWSPRHDDLILESYQIRLPGEAEEHERARETLERVPLVVERAKPDGTRIELPLHRDLDEVSCDPDGLWVRLCTGPGRSRIRDVLEAVGRPLDGSPPPQVHKRSMRLVPREADAEAQGASEHPST